MLQGILQDVEELVELEWLRNKIRRPPLYGIDCVFHRAETRDHDCNDARVSVSRSFNDPGAINARQPEVRDHDIERELLQQFESSLAAIGLDHLEAALRETLRHQTAKGGLVIDDKQVRSSAGCLQGANILTQANLTIARQQPIQRSKLFGGPCGSQSLTNNGRHQEACESIWTARPSRS